MNHTFLLVHGAWHGGWCWERVVHHLERDGHRVFAPTLSGLAERRDLLTPQVNLSTHISDVVEVIDDNGLENIVLCGHSYGGMVITGVADARHQAVRAIVYLDAFLPADGDSVASLTPLHQAVSGWLVKGQTVVPAPTAEHFGVNKQDWAWVDAQCTDHPLGGFTEAIRLAGNHQRIATKIYVRAIRFTAPWFDDAMARVRTDPTWRSKTLDCGHDAMIDMPREIVSILTEA